MRKMILKIKPLLRASENKVARGIKPLLGMQHYF